MPKHRLEIQLEAKSTSSKKTSQAAPNASMDPLYFLA